jgi:hypothetical protein
MLFCHIKDLKTVNYECGDCNACNPKSKLVYPFGKDLITSKDFVNKLSAFIEKHTPYRCEETTVLKNPDICVLDIRNGNKLICRAEAKYLEGKAFMKSEKRLEDPLKPKETLVVDEPKLISYFECYKKDFERYGYYIPIFIVWKFDRPCPDIGSIAIYQSINVLQNIYQQKGNKRTFKRQSGDGDIIGEKHLGIVDKYHFSIKECKPIEELPNEIMGIKQL